MSRGILVSPAEPPLIKTLGRSSAIPERFGSDVYVPSLRLGVQRKEVGDLVGSMGDRLPKEIQQMKRLAHKVLIVEGRFSWNADGEWINGFKRFTLDQYRGLLLSLQHEGVKILTTNDMRDTVVAIREAIAWASKDSHTSLTGRAKFATSIWGTKDDEDFQCWLVQGFDGIGPKVARAIVKQFGGAPLTWRVTEKELQQVPGVGKERARRLMKALNNGEA